MVLESSGTSGESFYAGLRVRCLPLCDPPHVRVCVIFFVAVILTGLVWPACPLVSRQCPGGSKQVGVEEAPPDAL